MVTTLHSPFPDLRRRCQRRAHGRRHEDMSRDFDATRLLHELQVHQIELETQNEELREARTQAQAALESYTELYDFAPLGYFTLDRSGLIQRLNLAGATMLGRERKKLVDKRFAQFIDMKDRPAFGAFLARVLGEHTQDSCELKLHNPPDPHQPRVIQLEAASDPVGRTVKMAAIDITEKKRATEELVRSNLELQQFAYIAAHDLQSPLRCIQGFVQLLLESYRGEEGDQVRNWSNQVVGQVQRMHALIQDLLSYSRIGSAGQPFELVELEGLVDELAASAQAALVDKSAVVSHGNLPTVMGDRLQLAQLLQNLIDNGIKYQSGRNGEVPKIHISARRRSGEWVISVRDNGIGIAAKHYKRIFDIFHRLHSQQAYPGTGIGLAICRRVVQRHGGEIWVESEPSQGSVFHFTLPDPWQLAD